MITGLVDRLHTDTLLSDRNRVLTNIKGRYRLEKDDKGRESRTSVFACRIQRISPNRILLAAPVAGNIGDIVVAHFEEFGWLRGAIERKLGFGFVMGLDLDKVARETIAGKIVWLEKHKNFAVTDARNHPRIVPSMPESTLVLADARVVPCFVIDMSSSGAAVSADVEVTIGMPLAVGTAVGRVVRLLDPGFAIHFLARLPQADIERRVIRTLAQTLPELRQQVRSAQARPVDRVRAG